jgi:hypothetical protein
LDPARGHPGPTMSSTCPRRETNSTGLTAGSSSGIQQRDPAAGSSSGRRQRDPAAGSSSGRRQRETAAGDSSGRRQRETAAGDSSGRRQRETAAGCKDTRGASLHQQSHSCRRSHHLMCRPHLPLPLTTPPACAPSNPWANTPRLAMLRLVHQVVRVAPMVAVTV